MGTMIAKIAALHIAQLMQSLLRVDIFSHDIAKEHEHA